MTEPGPLPPGRHAPVTEIKQLHFDIVDGCQLQCVGCPNSTLLKKPRFITPELFRTAVHNIDVQKVRSFRLFNYGEPLLHPRLAEIGRILREPLPFTIDNVEISTNGQSKNWDRLEAFLDLGVLNTLVISCDGDGTPESYEAVRPPAKWSSLMAFLEHITALRERRHRGLRIMTRSVIRTPEDAARWQRVLDPFDITPEFRGWKKLPQSRENMTGREVMPAEGVCFFVEDTQRLFVDADANVIPCCIHPGAGNFGSLATGRFSDILAGSRRAGFVAALRTQRATMPVCGECEFGPSENRGPSAGVGLDFVSREPLARNIG